MTRIDLLTSMFIEPCSGNYKQAQKLASNMVISEYELEKTLSKHGITFEKIGNLYFVK